jgi:hypothetical protein
MFGRNPHISSLAARKRLLISESELNRSQLSEEWGRMTDGVGDIAHRAKSFAAWTSSAALLLGGIMAWRRRGLAALGAAKPSWVQRILNGARVASTIWLGFRGRNEKVDRNSQRFPHR